jgi:xanthine dehydrogenase YagS FAD-binding subunit
MKPFEYAAPQTEADAVQHLNSHSGATVILAGGTDLMSLMKADLVAPKRVVNIKDVQSMRGITAGEDSIVIGALSTLEDLTESPLAAEYRALGDVVDGIRAIQIQQNGTVGGDLCLHPNCWYYRNGYGLLAQQDGESLVVAGDNRYHAIFNNRGVARYVHASRLAPALIAWNAKIRVIGPDPEQAQLIPLERFYMTPRFEHDSMTVLEPGQLISHIVLPTTCQQLSGAYEVLELQGLDWPLAAAASCVAIVNGVVESARIVMGHVAPTPIVSHAAAEAIVGHPINEQTADRAGQAAIADATPLKDNVYKLTLTKTSVKRSLLKAAGQLESELA